jgi:hypothetical protein
MLIYSAIALHFILRAHRGVVPGSSAAALLASKPIRTLVWSLSLADIAIIIRGIYRTVELAQGWTGYTIRTEVFTLVLDVSARLRPHSPPGHMARSVGVS